MLPALLEDLKKAERYIFMEYFIIDEGIMWGEILAILEEKAKAGLDVRVMFDGMNEMTTLSYDYIDRLHKVGIKAQSFSSKMVKISPHMIPSSMMKYSMKI